MRGGNVGGEIAKSLPLSPSLRADGIVAELEQDHFVLLFIRWDMATLVAQVHAFVYLFGIEPLLEILVNPAEEFFLSELQVVTWCGFEMHFPRVKCCFQTK